MKPPPTTSSPVPEAPLPPLFSERLATLLFGLMTVLCALAFALGLGALRSSPSIGAQISTWNNVPTVLHRDRPATAEEPLSEGDVVVEIQGLRPGRTGMLLYPEFFFRADEQAWWSFNRELFQRAKSAQRLTLRVRRPNGREEQVTLPVASTAWLAIAQRAGLSWISAGICLAIGIHIAARARSTEQQLTALLSSGSALFLFCMAAIRARDLALPPLPLRLLITFSYFGAATCITLIHFALIFPRPTPLIRRHPALSIALYVYMAASCLFYFSGLIAYGSTFYALIFWLLLAVLSFVYSFAREKEPLLKDIILLTVIPPVLVVVSLVTLVLLPVALRARPVDFTYYSLMVPILPFSLSFGTNSLRLYLAKQAADERIIRERNSIARELHDHLSNDLTAVTLCGQEARDLMATQKSANIEILLDTIVSRTQKAFWLVRDFISSISPEDCSWTGLVAQFEGYGYRALHPLQIHFKLDARVEPGSPMSALMYLHIFSMFKELLTNSIKYSKASCVSVRLRTNKKYVHFTVLDDGIGCVLGQFRGRGLDNMRKRVDDLAGLIEFRSEPGRGFRAYIRVPLHPK